MESNKLEFGIDWTTEPVSKQRGAHATDRVIIGEAQIPVVRDLAAFTAEFSAECVLGSLDGTSVRVMAQDVNRRLLEKGEKRPEVIRAAIINRLRGVRNSGARGTKEVKVYVLPGGGSYKGADLVELQQAVLVALVDAGTPADVARTIALTYSL